MHLEQIEEINKCAQDFTYFCKNYVYIKHPIKGKILFKLYPIQRNMINHFSMNDKTIFNTARQMGGSTLFAAYFLWKANFWDNKTLVYVSLKRAYGEEFLSIIRHMYEELPDWLRSGIDERNWNKSISGFENKSRIMIDYINPCAVKGMAVSEIIVDSLNFANNSDAEYFMASLYPVLSTSAKITINGGSYGPTRNLFEKMWNKAISDDEYDWKPMLVPYQMLPDRDYKFKMLQIKQFGEDKFNIDYRCEFPESKDFY